MPKRNVVVVLGASGDLARRKLIPSLSKLFEQGEISSDSIVIGSGRTRFTHDDFRARFPVSPDFARILFYHEGIEGLKKYIEKHGSFDRVVFFFALPPMAYVSTSAALAAEGFGREATCIIEKPFGCDYQSAQELNRALARHFDETRIFRIDHYLAKEAVQNILVFRFANSIFYPVWNSKYIESIQINAFEDAVVGDRAGYFDHAGIIRDMVQNHLTQLICLMTMEAPVSLDAEEIRAQKMNVLKAINVAGCCRMQYRGYRDEKGVAGDSITETYAEMKLFIDTFRWAGMPVYIRTGKALNRKGTEIGVRFKAPPRLLFNKTGDIVPNRIIFKIQPSEGIVLDLSSKEPGAAVKITNTAMTFCYHDSFDAAIPEAYQKLLCDALKGDRTLFVGAEETELSWKKYEPFLGAGELEYYDPGTVPRSRIGADWIDFEKYGRACR